MRSTDPSPSLRAILDTRIERGARRWPNPKVLPTPGHTMAWSVQLPVGPHELSPRILPMVGLRIRGK